MNMEPRRWVPALLLLWAFVAGTPAAGGDDAVHVYVSSALAPALDDTVEVCREARPDLTVVMRAGPSGVLRRHIEHGSRADLFVAPASEITRLEEAGLARPGTRRALVTDALLVAVRRGGRLPERFEALAQADFARIGIPNPTTVAEGAWAVQALDAFGLRAGLEAKLVRTASTTEALSRLVAGELDAALVPRGLAGAWADRVVAGPRAPTGAYETPRYEAAVPETAADVAGAWLLLDCLISEEGRAIFARRGYTTAPAR